MARFSDFNTCDLSAREMRDRLLKKGHEAVVVFGAYHPQTPKRMWDDRWQKIHEETHPFTGFVHFWVLCNNLIFDNAARQFGEPGNLMLNSPDPRYEIFGMETFDNIRVTFRDKPQIIWGFRSIPA